MAGASVTKTTKLFGVYKEIQYLRRKEKPPH